MPEKPELHGVFPPVITPFHPDGVVDEKAFLFNLEKWAQEDLAGFLVCGSNGESAYLDHAEKCSLVRLAARYGSTHHIMAGTGKESLKETLYLTKACADVGAQSALVITPFMYAKQMTDAALIRYFSQVADSSPIPILLYSVPKFTHVTLSAHAVAKLSSHPNIIGIKDSSGDPQQLAAYLAAAQAGFQVLVGSASIWLDALQLGLKGGILALANCYPKACIEVQRAFLTGQSNKAQAIQKILVPVNTALTSTFGIPGLKAACNLKGFQAGAVRSPLLDSAESERNQIKLILEQADKALIALD